MEKVITINEKDTDYSVNDKGVVFSLKRGKRVELKYNNINGGYKMCYLYVHGIRYDLLVHRVVAMTFIQNPENKKEVNHIDGNKENNELNNLEWVTPSENVKHAYLNGFSKKDYSNCWNSLFNEEEVREIRKMLCEKVKGRDIAKKFNTTEGVISHIKTGRSYSAISKNDLAIDINNLNK